MNKNCERSNAEKNMILRIFFALKTTPMSNTAKIYKILRDHDLPCYSLGALYRCLKELQMDGLVHCRIIRLKKNEPEIITDYFTLSNGAEVLQKKLETEGFSYERKSKILGKQFGILKCPKCKSYRLTHFPFTTIKCFNCSHRFLNSEIVACSKNKEDALITLKELKKNSKN